MYTDEEIQQSLTYGNLSPAYFCSRNVVERAMASVEAEHFKPLIDKLTKEINDTVWDGIKDHLLADTEMNLQNAMWHQIDASVKALLTGEEWALRQYALGGRYDHEKLRTAVAAHIPQELQDARVKDLEARNAELEKELSYWRERR